MQHIDARKLPPLALEDLRRKAVTAVQDGMTQAHAAKVFGVSRQTVNEWMAAYRAGGEAALTVGAKGRPKGSGGKLSAAQKNTIRNLVIDKRPEQLRLPFVLWTRDAVADLIERRFGVRLAVTTAGKLLRDMGMSPQKPLKRAWERDPAAIAAWLKHEYPAIHARAKREGAAILWGDEMGLRSDYQAGRSWSPKGKTPVFEGTGKRFGCNVISALSNLGGLSFMVFKGSMNVRVYLEFLKRLVKQARRKVFLIVDRHPVHRAKRVANWLDANARSIEQHFLPAYAPELNPDEYLNHDVKANAVGRRRPATQAEMISGVRGYLRSTQRQPDVVRNFFRHPDILYAA